MKIRTGQAISGEYMGRSRFLGIVESIHNDTAGGNFATARIILHEEIVSLMYEGDNREAILLTLDGEHQAFDSRYNLD